MTGSSATRKVATFIASKFVPENNDLGSQPDATV
jgi:hypothetical protein